MKNNTPFHSALRRAAGGAFACLLLNSCQNTSHLMVFQHTNMGLNTGISADTSNIHVRLGVRQEVGAVVPKVKHTDGAEEENAASAYVAMRVQSAGMYKAPEVNEIIASGQAAINLAADANGLAPFNSESSTQSNSQSNNH